MPRAEVAINEASVNGDEVLDFDALELWVLIGGLLEGEVLIEMLNIEETGDGVVRAQCSVVDPQTSIAEGMTFAVVWRGEVIFAGIIRSLTIDTDQAESAFRYAIEADGWDSLLARHTITATYTNKTAGFILRDAIAISDIDLDGVMAGVIDEGPELILVEANHVRVGDFIRDVGSAGGGLAYIDPYKRIQYRPTTLDVSDVIVTNARAEQIRHIGDIDNYRNRQIVKVTGLNGTTTVTETRNDLAQQALRIVDEGGSGIYENYMEVTHPTSSVSGELSILGQTVAYVQLRTFARNARRVTVTMRDPAPRIGQLVTVTLPGFSLDGTFIVMRKTWREVGGVFVFDVELWESNFQQRALESLLQIVGAAKSSISISANVFPNVQLFAVVGAFTWTVPAGVTSAQFTAWGGSGGGGGARAFKHVNDICFGDASGNGGKGGNSGKAVTILPVVEGQVYDVVVGAAGVKGLNGAPFIPCGDTTATVGTAGSLSKVSLSAVVKVQGNAGTGGGVFFFPNPGADGIDGGGIGDAVSVGGGHVGGANGRSVGDPWTGGIAPGNGLAGMVEVRW